MVDSRRELATSKYEPFVDSFGRFMCADICEEVSCVAEKRYSINTSSELFPLLMSIVLLELMQELFVSKTCSFGLYLSGCAFGISTLFVSEESLMCA